ncbi:MAG: AAA family ATPase [Pseudomonadota bacterium]|nr:AAA family ATPase [Pseudomonadota bacterium]
MSDAFDLPLPPLSDDRPITRLHQAIDQVSEIILGKPHQIRQAVACLLAEGHLLLEDVPGVGKTTLAHGLAQSLGLEFQRVQFTSDLLPADITGASIYERNSGRFTFHAGPIFTQLLLADEINRATPRTQSALLEAMAERQVTVDGATHRLPQPFFVIATQNPARHAGTFPLPESQLDRFLLRISLGYPEPEAERRLLRIGERRSALAELTNRLGAVDLLDLQRQVRQVHLAEPIVSYVLALLGHTRRSGWFREGLSPRAGLGLIRVAQAWALLAGRDHVLPEDVQALFESLAGHRLQPQDSQGQVPADARQVLAAVDVP